MLSLFVISSLAIHYFENYMFFFLYYIILYVFFFYVHLFFIKLLLKTVNVFSSLPYIFLMAFLRRNTLDPIL